MLEASLTTWFSRFTLRRGIHVAKRANLPGEHETYKASRAGIYGHAGR
jgi:hypothetical protein